MFDEGGREQVVLLHEKMKGGGRQVFAGNGKNGILSDITACILKN